MDCAHGLSLQTLCMRAFPASWALALANSVSLPALLQHNFLSDEVGRNRQRLQHELPEKLKRLEVKLGVAQEVVAQAEGALAAKVRRTASRSAAVHS